MSNERINRIKELALEAFKDPIRRREIAKSLDGLDVNIPEGEMGLDQAAFAEAIASKLYPGKSILVDRLARGYK